MKPTVKRSPMALLALVVLGSVFLAQPAVAQTILGTATTNSAGTFAATVVIPASTPPGIYDLTATGLGPVVEPYPPTSTGALSVSSNVVVAGSSIAVSGGGFAANTLVTLRLHFVASADATFQIAQATTTRTLTARIRVVAPGQVIHPDKKAPADPTVKINIDNKCIADAVATTTASSGEYRIAQSVNIDNSVECRAEAVAHAQAIAKAPPVKVLARTGADALPLLAAAMATILLGTVLLTAGRRRSRFGGSATL